MRCYYMSDLHLESQEFPWRLPSGDVLVIAGDLCHARVLDPGTKDRYGIEQRGRVLRFIEAARARFARVLLVAGNHEHYDGVFDYTSEIMRRHLDGVTVLDDGWIDIDGHRFFGTTLWSDFDGRNAELMHGVRRRMGEFFFVKRRVPGSAGAEQLVKFRPEDALAAHDRALSALDACLEDANGKPVVVVSHHAPSRQGLNPAHAGNGLDGGYASDLDQAIARMPGIVRWVHGHTHIARTYRIGSVLVHSNALGLAARGGAAPGFSPVAAFELGTS